MYGTALPEVRGLLSGLFPLRAVAVSCPLNLCGFSDLPSEQLTFSKTYRLLWTRLYSPPRRPVRLFLVRESLQMAGLRTAAGDTVFTSSAVGCSFSAQRISGSPAGLDQVRGDAPPGGAWSCPCPKLYTGSSGGLAGGKGKLETRGLAPRSRLQPWEEWGKGRPPLAHGQGRVNPDRWRDVEARGSGRSFRACVTSCAWQQGCRNSSIRAGAPQWGLSFGGQASAETESFSDRAHRPLPSFLGWEPPRCDVTHASEILSVLKSQ